MKETIGIIAALLVIGAYIPYVIDTLKHKTKPHPYSWFIWGFLSAIIFALQISHGSGAGSYVTATVAVASLVICFLSIRGSKDSVTFSDTLFFISALIAIGFWLVANQPVLSMVLLIIIDMLGLAPSIRKAWSKPDEETLFTWELNGFRHALSIFAIQSYSIITLLNPLVWTVANTFFSAMLIARRKHLR